MLRADPAASFDFTTDVLILGAGACGLSAALAAADQGAGVVVLERDQSPSGTSAMSTGLIPAAGTQEQQEAGIPDTPQLFASDITAKSAGGADPDIVRRLTEESAETVSWLRRQHGVPLSLVDGFLYPGHSRRRMYGTPNRSGAELIAALVEACRVAGADILTDSRAETLITDETRRVLGVEYVRPDGARETVGCRALVIATCGFAGDPALMAQWIPEMSGAVFHGHPGADGDAVRWGEAIGASLCDMSAYQGHGGLAYGHGIPILWPAVMEGGFQVNRRGERFSDESKGYSEQAAEILRQPEGAAWTVFDARIESVMMQFDDYQDAMRAGAIKTADTIEDLARLAGLPADGLTRTFDRLRTVSAGMAGDAFGRDFSKTEPLAPPYRIVRVSGAVFHTQGGLDVDADARVKRRQGGVFPNLFAGGGAARGVSGANASGYIAGNGLLTATSLGKIAGRNAAAQIRAEQGLKDVEAYG